MSKASQAEKTFLGGVNCAQAILITYGPAFGLDDATALRIASGLGGGMGHTGGVCGAVAGGAIVLGLKYGIARRDAPRMAAIEEVQKYLDRVKEHLGSTECLVLLGRSIRRPEDLQKARDEEVFKTRCAEIVKTAAEILEESL